MEMLKAPTIWESASRPLFVRSIWLEAAKTGRAGPQRHFILDYEPNQRRMHSKSAVSSSRNKAHATLQHSNSYDFVGDWQSHRQCGFAADTPTDLLLIVPAKVEPLPANTATTPAAQQKFPSKPLTALSKTQKRTTLFFRNHAVRRGPLHELYELYSRHSSLQDLQSTLSQANSHADERLAERVLNWLDLAGKRVETQKTQPIDGAEMVKRGKKLSTKQLPAAPSDATAADQRAQRISAIKSHASAPPPPPTTALSRSRKNVRYAAGGMRADQTPNTTTTAALASQSVAHSRPTDPVKHITIIFDREGVPVRFNRPVRNIDLCTLSASPATVRRLAGPLASARLYSETERCVVNQSPPTKVKPSKCRSSEMEYSAFGMKASHKRSHDAGVFDAKKQLHIFMPSLPKKGLLTAVGANVSGCGSVDDTLSGLSNTFSEFCKI